jgi:hypothetical protein
MKRKTIRNINRRTALVEVIREALSRAGQDRLRFDASSYRSEKDMVHFTAEGHRCILYGIRIRNGTPTTRPTSPSPSRRPPASGGPSTRSESP